MLLLPLLCLAVPLQLRIVYDNTAARPGLKADWGFAAVVDSGGHRVLFDSGAKRDVLLANLAALGIDPASVERVVVSHAHGDHAAGLLGGARIPPRTPVFFLDSFPPAWFERMTALGLAPQRVRAPAGILPGIYTTGVVEGQPPEQSLVIETTGGLVLLTGCSHPGIVKMVEAAEKQRGRNSVRLVVGGFHMLNDPPPAIESTIERLRALKVERVAPTHCTGAAAIVRFREVYGEQFQPAGAGQQIDLK